jgi:hypothetical protein
MKKIIGLLVLQLLISVQAQASEKGVSKNSSKEIKGICQAVKDKKSLESLNYVPVTKIHDDIKTIREETHSKGITKVDFDNDGTEENLVLLEYASGAGRGCDYNYYDTLDNSRKEIQYDKKHSVLMKLQNLPNYTATDTQRTGVCKVVGPKWFMADGKTYFEVNKGNRRKITETIILLVEGNKTKEICR